MKKINLLIASIVLIILICPVKAFAQTNALTYYNKAVDLYNANKYQDSLKYYDLAIKSNTKYGPAYTGKGMTLLCLKKYEDAIKTFDIALQLNPKDIDALICKGRSLYYLNRNEEALLLYDKAISINPKLAMLYVDKGDAFYNMKRYEDAIKAYDTCIRLNPSAYAHYSKGAALFKLGKYEEALKSYDNAIKINPKYSDAYISKGDMLNNLNRFDEALKCFDKAQELAPNDTSINVSRGNTFYFKGMYDEAIKYYDIAIKANYSNANIYYTKGRALYYSGKYAEAITCLNLSLKYETDEEASIYYYISLSYVKNEDVKMYLPALKQAISLDNSYKIDARTNEGFKSVANTSDFIELVYDATESLNSALKDLNILKEDNLVGIKFLDLQSTGNNEEDAKILQAQKEVMKNFFIGNIYNEATADTYHISKYYSKRSDTIKTARYFKGMSLVGYVINFSISDDCIVSIGKTSNDIKAVIVKGTYTIKIDSKDISIEGIIVLLNNNGIWEYNGGVIGIGKEGNQASLNNINNAYK